MEERTKRGGQQRSKEQVVIVQDELRKVSPFGTCKQQQNSLDHRRMGLTPIILNRCLFSMVH